MDSEKIIIKTIKPINNDTLLKNIIKYPLTNIKPEISIEIKNKDSITDLTKLGDDIKKNVYHYCNENTIITNIHDIENIGGKKKKPVKKNSTLKTFEIKDLATELLNVILTLHTNVINNNIVNDMRLLEVIRETLRNRNINITKEEHEFLIRYIKENIFNILQHNFIVSHPLYSTVKNTDFKLYMIHDSNKDDVTSLNNKVTLSKILSNSWTDISSLIKYNKRISFENNLIHPLFFILYGCKFPGFEDLTILQDYVSMLNNLKKGYYNVEESMLVFLRTADVNILPTKNLQYATYKNNEILRMNIAILLRELSISIRRGCFENVLSDKLLSILNDIKMPNAKTEEENLIQAIFATFSFKPTLINQSRYYDNILNANIYKKNTYNIPTAAYNIEYPLPDINLLNNNTRGFITNNSLKNISYNPLTKKLTFLYNDNNVDVNNMSYNELLKSYIDNLATQEIDVNLDAIKPTIITRAGIIQENFGSYIPVSILLTNGIFIISVNREQNKYFVNPENNYFFASNNSSKDFEYINITPISVDEVLTISNINYHLKAALCYDFIDDNMNYFNKNPFDTKIPKTNKIGTFALIKTNMGWIEYNTNNFIIPTRIQEFINNAMSNYRKNNLNLEESILTKNLEKIKNDIYENKICIEDMLIDDETAKLKLETKSCLLFYSENYDNYKSRIEEKLFSQGLINNRNFM